MPDLFVPGNPIPSPRPQVIGLGYPCTKCKKRPHTRVILGKGEMARRAQSWKDRIKQHAIVSDMEMIEGPLEVDLVFLLQTPGHLLKKSGGWRKGARQHPIGARDGDTDNLAKAVLDALHGTLYKDDTQVVALKVTKRWAANPHAPGVSIRYTPHTEQEA